MSSAVYYFVANLLGFTLATTYFFLALTAVLFMISTRIPAAGFFARLLASYFCLVFSALFGVCVSIFLRLIGYGRISQWATARCFQFVMKYSTGVQFVIEDPHNYLNTTRPAVFIANHQTELDVLLLGAVFPQYCSVTAKSSLKKTPFLGWFMMLSYSVFLDRSNPSIARSAMTGAADEIRKDRQSVFMFPEGTRSYYKEPGLLPFKKGAFHLAVQANVPIVPVVAANYSDVLDVKNWVFKSGKILIKILRPIETTKFTASDVEDLTRDTRELMLTELLSLTERQRGNPLTMPAAQINREDSRAVRASGVEATKSSLSS